MIHVCHITTVHQPFDTRIFHKECKTLAKTGYEVSLIAPKADNNQMTNDQITTVVDEVKMIYLPEARNRFFRILCLTKKAYKIALKQKANIYHFHDPEFLPWAIKLKEKTGSKTIYDVHEDTPQQILSKKWIPKILRRPIASIFNFYEKQKARHLDFVITAWPVIKEKFEREGINNIEVVANYPVIGNLQLTTEYRQHKAKNEETKLIYAGGLTRIRGIKEMVKSLGFIKNDVKLILLGKFQEEGLEEELKELSEWRKVEFKGWLSQKAAYKNMRESDIGLICFLPAPNHINAIPNKPFEYMASGLPVVASNFPLWERVVKTNKCGLTVNPEKPKEIAKAIKYLIEHPQEAKKMGENGKKAVFEKYNWEKESKKLLDIYQQLTTDNSNQL